MVDIQLRSALDVPVLQNGWHLYASERMEAEMGGFYNPQGCRASSVSQGLPAIHLLNMHLSLFLLMLLEVEFLNIHFFSSFLPFFMRETISGAGKKRFGSEENGIFKCISHLSIFIWKTTTHCLTSKIMQLILAPNLFFFKKNVERNEWILKWLLFLK